MNDTRSAFLDRWQKQSATAYSVLWGDVAQIVADVERRRLSVADAEAMIEDALTHRLLHPHKAQQVKERLDRTIRRVIV